MHQEQSGRKEDIFGPTWETVLYLIEKGVRTMSESEKPLPQPQNPAFGRRSRFQEKEPPSLIADDIVRAAADGRLEKLFGTEIPDTDEARALVSMMMGMSGMSSFAAAEGADEKVSPKPPGDILRAVEGGDVAGLMELLQKEHQRRSGNAEQPAASEISDPEGGRTDPPGKPTVEKEVIDGLLRIASDNQVTLDWVILRALKVYVRGYRETGLL
jgi:hypothetical protein